MPARSAIFWMLAPRKPLCTNSSSAALIILVRLRSRIFPGLYFPVGVSVGLKSGTDSTFLLAIVFTAVLLFVGTVLLVDVLVALLANSVFTALVLVAIV